MSENYTRPTYLEVSNHFFHDAEDFNIRYKYCIDSEGPLFFTPRSRRAKCFVDLRMGVESILKSLVCYFANDGRKGKTLVNWIEKFGHNLGKMIRKLENYLPDEIIQIYKADILKMDELPVSLRYRFDTWDFRGSREKLYYETIGSGAWLSSLQEALEKLIDLANENLKPHSRIVSVSELAKEIFEPRYEKYT